MSGADEPTVIVEQYRQAATTKVNSNSYRGLRIHALPGLHDFVGRLAAKYFVERGTVFDMAAGSGALSLRLQDLGFRVSAADFVAENFKLHDTVPFVRVDLNADVSSAVSDRFDGIVASEIIEHLENPRHFARQCHRLLKSGGRLILSTPNIDSPESQAAFIFRGTYLWFADDDYSREGHIMPLAQWTLRKAFAEAGFDFVWSGSFGRGSRKFKRAPHIKLLAMLVWLFSARKGRPGGQIFVAVLEKRADAIG